MKQYSCGFMFDQHGRVLLVRKKKPAWQSGKLNGIGGLTEAGETQLQCMIREWREETSDTNESWTHVCYLVFHNDNPSDDCRIDFYTATTDREFSTFPYVNDSGEPLEPVSADRLPDNVIDNLRWLIPLSRDAQSRGHIGGVIKQ